MIDYMVEFDEDTRAIVDLTRKLVHKHQMPLEARKLQGGEITPQDLLPGTRAAREVGLWGLTLPEHLGGARLTVTQQLAVTEESYQCLVPLQFGGRVPPFLFNATGVQKARYLDPCLEDRLRYAFAQTEPSGGADPGNAIQTKAVKRGDKWVINGTKVFISSVGPAEVIFVVAVTDQEKRQHGGISMFAVDKSNPGLKVSRDIQTLDGMITNELIFDNCEVTEDALIGASGEGFRNAQIILSQARFGVGARALGIAMRTLDMMTEYAKQRVAFGSALSQKQAIQAMVVDSWIDINQCRLMMYAAARKADAGHDTRVEASLIKMQATEVVGRVLDRGVQVFGAAGVSLDNPIAHWYRSQRPARIYEGPTEVHKYHVLARHLFR
ncbi:acyl-CoA dehydrogenase family protein [Cupriavidus oxalaticus]|uniref:(R)-benzylsuccinyl-CoA dehydrogenase n=1 Tax=Cupriavidus oxalaticus TaxID=96344 RepID=A0A375GH83_9BURK|nr:acyl-CoA dehydrogenase family protein [Cupriavidus oxalaticus]QRQ84237.1 acyl-CoA dehydrogenase family protein [Cupriavidus oxalaticus]QRQ91676.1 acyl-CoA dehydrogenase family protein [Cupriavidus oxalaticus]WQD86258.1 acyl-CoA dehydrogenase family protein [Cupriavidus oxalaticus]SPC05177.1 putative (R)-benzylsuccinyl-CoA dehydrogenase [Cupriavidus oxalaticus]SPC18024.1 putative (R)-benzylsuccinyl-CoA dehydrogenase [Cupriavidus oxalaticus]